MSKAKKVILVIVEGPTDEDALSSVLKQIFSSAEVHFHVIYGDITTEDAITANNAKSYVAKRIAAEMKKYAYKESDILQIVHLIDTDGASFTYEIRKGRSGEYTKELWIDRRENSKSLAWSSVLLALGNVKEVGAVVDRPKALGDIRGVTYIYGMFYRFGVIDVPDDAKCKMNRCRCVSKG